MADALANAVLGITFVVVLAAVVYTIWVWWTRR
jgi:hypothetical protein